MKPALWIPLIFVLLPWGSRAQALPDSPIPTSYGNDGWNKVRTLSQGNTIAVTLVGGDTYRCTVTVPSDDSLACVYMRGYATRQDYEFAREDILEVRHRHPVRDIAITSEVVAALAFVVGGRQLPGPFNVKNGAIAALVAGGVTPAIVWPFVALSPGNLIYRKAHTRTGYVP